MCVLVNSCQGAEAGYPAEKLEDRKYTQYEKNFVQFITGIFLICLGYWSRRLLREVLTRLGLIVRREP